MAEADIANAAVKYAAETGRLDFLTAALGVLTIVLGLSAFPMFFFLKWRAEAVAREAAEGILGAAQERIEQLAISRMEQMLPTLVNEYAEIATNAVDGGVADEIAAAQEGGDDGDNH